MMRRAASVAVLCAPWLCLHAQQVPTFTSRTEAVRVDVLVSRGGHPVLGLSPSDFDVRDDGVLQQVDHAAFEEIPLNVVLALAYYTPLVSRLYRDRGDPSPVDGRPLALSVRLPLLVLAALTVVLGVWPSLASGLTAPAAAALLAAFGA